MFTNTDVEQGRDLDAMTHELKRVLSDPKSLEHIESSTHIMSKKFSNLNNLSLEIDPEDFDLIKTLRLLSQRFDEQGFSAKSVGITYQGLSSIGVDAGAVNWPTVSEIGYSIANLPKTIGKKQAQRHIIHDHIGAVKPGELLLVLGRPGAGCSTLLKTLAGETDGFTEVQGQVLYDGASMDQMNKHFKKEVLYNPERK